MNSSAFHNVYSVYPGEFVPMLKEEEVKDQLKRPHSGESLLPPVNVIEYKDSFQVEMAIPGIKREEFMIHADRNILSVCVLHKECNITSDAAIQQHEFNYECFDRSIILPKTADTEFISAEYREGILYLNMPKSTAVAKNLHTRIVVY